jgi:protein-S-isoprenylcysteine O-methyltransferase Ste14
MTRLFSGAPLREVLFEVVLRVSAVLAGMLFVVHTFTEWHRNPGRITLLLLLVGEVANVTLLLCSRVPSKRDWSPLAIVATLAATYYFLAVNLSPGIHLIPELLASGLQVTGLALALYAKLSLRLSFGLLPANRGVVTTGAYRFTRHPMYSGYFLNHLSFLLANFSVQNLLVYIGLYVFQVYRVLREEALLTEDAAYQAYRLRVRFRVLPGVF